MKKRNTKSSQRVKPRKQLPRDRIPSNRTVSVPAKAAESFPDVFLRRVVIDSPPDIEGSTAILLLQPYNHTTGGFGPTSEILRVEFEDVDAVAVAWAREGDNKLQLALNALVAAVKNIMADTTLLAGAIDGVLEIPAPEEAI